MPAAVYNAGNRVSTIAWLVTVQSPRKAVFYLRDVPDEDKVDKHLRDVASDLLQYFTQVGLIVISC